MVAHFYYQKEKNGGTFTGKKKKNIGGMILKLTRLFIHARYGPS